MCKRLSIHSATRHIIHEIKIIHYSKKIKLHPKTETKSMKNRASIKPTNIIFYK